MYLEKFSHDLEMLLEFKAQNSSLKNIAENDSVSIKNSDSPIPNIDEKIGGEVNQR